MPFIYLLIHVFDKYSERPFSHFFITVSGSLQYVREMTGQPDPKSQPCLKGARSAARCHATLKFTVTALLSQCIHTGILQLKKCRGRAPSLDRNLCFGKSSYKGASGELAVEWLPQTSSAPRTWPSSLSRAPGKGTRSTPRGKVGQGTPMTNGLGTEAMKSLPG